MINNYRLAPFTWGNGYIKRKRKKNMPKQKQKAVMSDSTDSLVKLRLKCPKCDSDRWRLTPQVNVYDCDVCSVPRGLTGQVMTWEYAKLQAYWDGFSKADKLAGETIAKLQASAVDDSQRIDFLQSKGNGQLWVARELSCGRGWRLHNTGDSEYPGARKTVREAIDAVMISERNGKA